MEHQIELNDNLTTVKLGYNEQLGTNSLEPANFVRYNRGALKPGFVITGFLLTEKLAYLMII